MPMIIDANRKGDFSQPIKRCAEQILEKIKQKKLKIVTGGQLTEELAGTALAKVLVECERTGNLIKVTKTRIKNEMQSLGNLKFKSNDIHVIVLARVSGARLLFTDDRKLIDDMKDVNIISPKGKVITSATSVDITASMLRQFGG